jgi:hypothetical protein
MTTQKATLTCPMCEYECAEWDDFRFHLHTRHAKSDLVEELVDEETERTEVIAAP